MESIITSLKGLVIADAPAAEFCRAREADMEMLRKSIESSKVASETCPASARTVSVLEKTLSEAKCKSFYHDVQRKRPFRQFFDTITLPPGETLPQLEAYTALRNAEDKTYQTSMHQYMAQRALKDSDLYKKTSQYVLDSKVWENYNNSTTYIGLDNDVLFEMVLTIRAIPEKFAVSTAKGTLEYWTNKHSQNTQEEKDLSAQVEELKEEYGKAEDSFWASLNALVTE